MVFWIVNVLAIFEGMGVGETVISANPSEAADIARQLLSFILSAFLLVLVLLVIECSKNTFQHM
jgi:hypothetical protein